MTYVRNEAGNPLLVYRGEHGPSGQCLETRYPSITFTEYPDIASGYASHPNNLADCNGSKSPRVIPAYLDIQNPVVNTPCDPFVELVDLEAALGRDEAVAIAMRLEESFTETNNWFDSIQPRYGVDTIEDFFAVCPDGTNKLYGEAFRIFDDPQTIATLKAHGYDGAIHAGVGESMRTAEYRVFDPSQVTFALEQVPVEPELTDDDEMDLS